MEGTAVAARRAALTRHQTFTVAGLHLFTRLATLLSFAAAAERQHVSLATILTKWDGGQYQQVAAHGYPHGLFNSHAFFPFYPLATHIFTALGMPFWMAGAAINLCLSTLAAVAIHRLCLTFLDPSRAFLVPMLWSVYPLAGALSATYSESLFTLLAATCLLALQRERWLLAGLLALLAGATRPTGLALTGCCAVACLVAIRGGNRSDGNRKSMIAVVLAPLGFLASLIYIGACAGHLDAWFTAERVGWHAHFDGGADTAHTVIRELSGHAHTPFAFAQGIFVVLAVVLAIVAVCSRQPPSLRVYVAIGVVLALGTSSVHASIARFLLPIFPMLVPVASMVDRLSRTTQALLLSGALAVSVALSYFYWGVSSFSP